MPRRSILSLGMVGMRRRFRSASFTLSMLHFRFLDLVSSLSSDVELAYLCRGNGSVCVWAINDLSCLSTGVVTCGPPLAPQCSIDDRPDSCRNQAPYSIIWHSTTGAEGHSQHARHSMSLPVSYTMYISIP
eukprot:scpid87448/ scgid35126/ 